MTRPTAAERFRRIVAILPWMAARPGVEVAEVCARFDVTQQELLADLEVVFMVGIPPYTPDALIDVAIEEGRAWIHLGEAFTQPLRLTTAEVLRLVAAGRGALRGADEATRATLERAVAKVLAALGQEGEAPVGIRLGEADDATLTVLRQAADQRRRVRIDYYSQGSDTRAEREVDPLALAARDGHWYLLAHCHRAGAERIFRVDRIASIERLDQRFDPPPDAAVPRPGPGAGAPSLTVEVDGTGEWLVEEYRATVVGGARSGRQRLRFPADGDAWVQRALLQLGPGTDLVDGDVERGGRLVRDAAAAILARYR